MAMVIEGLVTPKTRKLLLNDRGRFLSPSEVADDLEESEEGGGG